MQNEAFVATNGNPVLLEVTLSSPVKKKVDLIVYDPYWKNTQYTNREMYVEGEKTFFIRMPVTPNATKVFSTANIVKIEKKHLPRKFSEFNIPNQNVRKFVEFGQEFCAKCGYLKDNLEYLSDNEVFVIKYLPVILNKEGKEDATPCRISKSTGIMEVSARRFRGMTVPMRFALILHEYMHFWKNKNPESELEADRNSLFVYLGLGYPRYEAFTCWLETFDKTGDKAHPAHKQRLEQIRKIIDQYDKVIGSLSFIK